MAYRDDEFVRVHVECNDICTRYKHRVKVWDWTGNVTWEWADITGPGTAYLPHSCNEWEIGGMEEVKRMIRDLKKVLKKLEGGE